ncbi:VIT1/CCC1 transporter family protein [Corynebacterium pyruviciproducens]|uniref:VIT1/CCC1 transporter family protein n=1 Tax=Corynebacterium pyruviciproducens TaxID=598660 RepID=UPI0023F45097|nr:VIT1/CCC1 transporter family protein [Corynebacterium pyruviciproducens]
MPSQKQIRRWRKYLANEREEARTYRALAAQATGEQKEILEKVAQAEARHERYWEDMLGPYANKTVRPSFETRVVGTLARRFGSVFTLALLQAAEQRRPYESDADATDRLTADEKIHAEIVRGLAATGREKLSGNFRAAVFGANDGLVSNLALVIGMVGSGVSNQVVLLTGVSGLLAGALSMAAGEFVSVSSQKELLDASTLDSRTASSALPALDLKENELALVFRARGMGADEATALAHEAITNSKAAPDDATREAAGDVFSGVGGLFEARSSQVVGSGAAAALASFCFFAVGAFVPIVAFLFPVSIAVATCVSLVLVGCALMVTGGFVGVMSGASPMKRALRQLGLGFGAAAVTYVLGLGFSFLL